MANCPNDETIIVVNPNTGKKINLAPLFEYFERNSDFTPGGFEVLLDTIEHTLRFISVEASLSEADPKAISMAFLRLYLLKDALHKISEFN